MSETIDTTAQRIEEPKPEEKKETLPVVRSPLLDIEMKEGSAVPKNIQEMRHLATIWLDGGVPKSYKNWQQIVSGMSFARGLGLPVDVSSLKNIAVINGNPSLWGDLPKKLAEDSGELEEFDEYLIDKNHKRIEFIDSWDQIYAAVCVIKKKDQPEKKFTFTRFQAEQGIQGVKAIWKGYYDVMMIRKVRARALNSEFTSVLGGRSIAEHDHNFAPDANGMEQRIKDVTNTVSNDLDHL